MLYLCKTSRLIWFIICLFKLLANTINVKAQLSQNINTPAFALKEP